MYTVCYIAWDLKYKIVLQLNVQILEIKMKTFTSYLNATYISSLTVPNAWSVGSIRLIQMTSLKNWPDVRNY